MSFVTEQRLVRSVVATVEQRPQPHSAARHRFDGSRVMTLYMLFAGLGILIYTGAANAGAAVFRFSGTDIAFGPRFAFFASLSIFLAAVILFYPSRRVRAHSSGVNRRSAWRRRIVVTALATLGGGVAVLIPATQEPGDAPLSGDSSISLPNESQGAVVGSESARILAAGRTLFQERGCVGCHRPDGTGDGPTLHGLFGSPVQYPASGTGVADESFLSEAILNPSAAVALGFLPIMPTFAGQLTEEELQALIVYVKSLGARP
jgi:mono/diheme cytochrome c family protein